MKKLCLIIDYDSAAFPVPELSVLQSCFQLHLFAKERPEQENPELPDAVPLDFFPLHPPKAPKMLWYLRCPFQTYYRQELQRHPDYSQKQLQTEVRKFLLDAEMMRHWLKQKGCFRDAAHTVYYSSRYGVGTLALVLQKMRQPEMKVVTRAKGSDFYQTAQPRGQLFKEMMDSYLDLISFSSRMDKFYYEQHFGKKKADERYRVFYSGVPDNGLNPKAEAKAPLQLFSCISSEKIPFQYMECLVQALRLVDFPVNWYGTGAGRDLPRVQALCHQLLDVKPNLTWRVSGTCTPAETASYCRTHHVDLFLTNGTAEGLPVSLMAAYSYGIPVAAPAVGGIPEMINSGTGYLLSSAPTPEEIAQVICRHAAATQTERATLCLNARQIWHNSFHDRKNCEKFAKALLQL